MLPAMTDIGGRIASLREKLGYTQQQFADALGGVSRGAVGNWEIGKGIKRDNLAAIATRFGVGIEWLMSGAGPAPTPREPANASVRGPAYTRDEALSPEAIPAYGQAMGGEDGYFVLNGNKVADLLAPPSLRGVLDAYAVYVSGDSMEPRYFAGEALFVNPRMPVRRGDFVVAQLRFPSDDMERAYVKRFVRMSGDELVLEQYNPAKELRFPRENVRDVHRIVMSGDG